MTEFFFLVGIGATLVCFTRRRRRAGVLAAYVGAVLVSLAWALSWLSVPLWPLNAAQAFALSAVFIATNPVGDRPLPLSGSGERDQRRRRVLSGGARGAAPGLVLIAVPLVLYELGIVGASAAELVYLGLPVLAIGLVFGAAFASAARPGGGYGA